MAQRPKEVPVVQARHERNRYVTVRPELVEGSLSKDITRVLQSKLIAR
jgi:hypothetical protein